MTRDKLIPVLPKNYRSIALHAVGIAVEPVVLMNGKPVTDFSDRGQLTQRGIRSCRGFEVRDGTKSILGFHDHPNEMWVTEPYADLAAYCARKGWLKLEGPVAEGACAATIRRFVVWTLLGLTIPGVLLAFVATFDRTVPYWSLGLPRPWEANLAEILVWIQIAYVGVGIWLLPGRRRAAVFIGLVHIVLAAWLGLHAIMAITGAWL